MSFVNERISAEDRINFDIDRINKTYLRNRLDWTVDRDRNSYLREVSSGREERQGYDTWNFYWNGDLIELVMYSSDIQKNQEHERARITWNIERYGIIDQTKRDAFLARKDEFFTILKEALTAYQLGGAFMQKSFDHFDVEIKVDPAFEASKGKHHG